MKQYAIEGKYFVRYDATGRKRKNWVQAFRTKSRRFLKDKCEKCKSKYYLTIHHKKPLPKGWRNGMLKGIRNIDELNEICLNKNNCQTLCRDCHDMVHKFGSQNTRSGK